jgi:hypothetical protein
MIEQRRQKRWLLGLAPVLAVIGAALLAGVGSARTATQPSNTAEPRIVGSVAVGATLTATNGTWSGTAPITYAYQWRRCPKSGGSGDASDCGVIPSATKSAYQVESADVGFTLRVRVTATNTDGSASAASNHTATVQAAATKPAATNPPTVSGSAAVGQTLTANAGTWSGSQPITFAYQWSRCDQNGGSCADIGGATDKTYVLKSVDAANTLRVHVTAHNSAGSASATSVPTAVVSSPPAPPAPPATGCPSGSGTVPVQQLSSPARLVIDSLRVSPGVVSGSAREIEARFHVSACGGRAVQGALVYTSTVPFHQFTVPPEQQTGSDGWATLRMTRQAGFPASRNQQLLVMFVRARKPGENVLTGISSRRLVSFHVSLST